MRERGGDEIHSNNSGIIHGFSYVIINTVTILPIIEAVKIYLESQTNASNFYTINHQPFWSA